MLGADSQDICTTNRNCNACKTFYFDFHVSDALVKADDVPLYALDKHTRLGREAIWRFACENDSVRACLARFVPASQRRSAAYVAAFYVDAAPIARRLMWDQSEALEAFGIERDLLHAGVPAEGIQPLLEGHAGQSRASQ